MTEITFIDAEVLLSGVKANFSLDSIALTDWSPGSWSAFARSLQNDLIGFQTTPLNYMKAHRDYFRLIQYHCSRVSTHSEAVSFLKLLLDDSHYRGKPNEIRYRTGTRYLIEGLRYSNIILVPLGGLAQSSLPWLERGQSYDPPLEIVSGKLLKDVEELSTNYGINEKDCLLLRTLYCRFVLAVRFDKLEQFDDQFYSKFWHFMDDVILPRYVSKKTSPTAYSRMLGLFNKIFEFFYIIARRDGLNILPEPNYSSKHWRRLKRAEDGVGSATFGWLTKSRPHLSEWSKAFAWYVSHQPLKQPLYISNALKKFIAFLITMESPPPSPDQVDRSHIVRREGSPGKTFFEFLQDSGDFDKQIGYVAATTLRKFFSRWHDEFGTPSPLWQNPVRDHDFEQTWKKGDISGKTNKEILPVRIIKMMKTIIVEDDYAWPKTLSNDYFNWFSTDGGYKRIWCPTRAIGLLLMLTVPIRTIQMRLLDSGEGDEFIVDSATMELVENRGQWVEAGRREGLLRKIYDPVTHRDYIGLHITTNKSAPTGAAEFETPYDIPWQCDELLPHLVYQREWQKTHNPSSRKLSRRDLSDVSMRPSESATNLPEYHFLFRDPSNQSAARDEPVPHGRERQFFLYLLGEVERRLQSQGEDVHLVDQSKRELSSPYSLHGLRAAGITHFIEAGVPIQVIAEFVAGHTTILMTLHYSKFGPNYITRILDEASERIENGMETDFIDFLAAAELDSKRRLVIATDSDGMHLLADTTPGVWSIDLDGICPAGRAMCDVGGEKLSAHNNPYYAPVPGGPRNCPRCRFFITGPAFLNGQVIAFNNLAFAMSERAKDLNRLKETVARMSDDGKQGRALERQANLVTGLEIEINEMLKTWQARFALIERSRALMKTSDEAGAQQLLSRADQGDFELILEQTSEFDLIEFVSQACELFPEKAEPSAPLRKGKILDQFLKNNGHEPLFYSLDDNEALLAGNRLTRFLQEKVGRDRVRSLMDGNATLKELGVGDEFDIHLFAAAKPLQLTAPQHRKN